MTQPQMTRRQFLNMLGASSATLLMHPILSCTQADKQPNILLILSDDAGYSDFGFMGNNQILTPNIDYLAESGAIFSEAYVTASVCAPSRAGLLTGRYQQRYGFEGNLEPGFGLDIAENTLGDALRAQGYRTGLFGKWHLGSRSEYHPNNRGFDEFYGVLAGSRPYFFSERSDSKDHHQALFHNHQQVQPEGYLTDIFADQACNFIESTDEQPFFCYLSFTAVHTPMQAKQEDLEKFHDQERTKLKAMTWAMDQAVGRVISALKATHQLDDTLIIFTNDNGGAANNTADNTPLKGWKGNKFEGGLKVPLILSWKDHIPAGSSFHGITSTLDIFATAQAAASANTRTGDGLDGVNLLPFLRGHRQGDPHEWLFWRKEEEAAARWKHWKLIRLKDYGSVLYNLRDDPGETVDRTASDPEIAVEMEHALAEWERDLKPPRWHEPQEWRVVTYDIHRELMQNLQVSRTAP